MKMTKEKSVAKSDNAFMTENFCDDCDDVLHAVFDYDDFWSFKVGRIRCKCGAVMRPCNECFGTDIEDQAGGCENCPWNNAKITDALSDDDERVCNIEAMPVPEHINIPPAH